PVSAPPLLPVLLPASPPVEQQRHPAPVAPAPPPRPVWLKSPPPRQPAPPAATGSVIKALLAFNRSFDRGTTLLAPPGRLRRGPQGRAFLGWAGLAMFAAALAWAVVRFLG